MTPLLTPMLTQLLTPMLTQLLTPMLTPMLTQLLTSLLSLLLIPLLTSLLSPFLEKIIILLKLENDDHKVMARFGLQIILHTRRGTSLKISKNGPSYISLDVGIEIKLSEDGENLF